MFIFNFKISKNQYRLIYHHLITIQFAWFYAHPNMHIEGSYNDESMEDVDEADAVEDENDGWFEDDEPEEEKEITFTILQKDGLIRSQKELIDEVIAQVSLTPADTALLLQHFKYVEM
jgi:hypothetical protein